MTASLDEHPVKYAVTITPPSDDEGSDAVALHSAAGAGDHASMNIQTFVADLRNRWAVTDTITIGRVEPPHPLVGWVGFVLSTESRSINVLMPDAPVHTVRGAVDDGAYPLDGFRVAPSGPGARWEAALLRARSLLFPRQGVGFRSFADVVARTFVADLGLDGVTVTGSGDRVNARFVFTLTREHGSCTLEVPGVPVEHLRWTGADGEDPRDYSPVLLDDSSMPWLAAIQVAHAELGGDPETTPEQHTARMNARAA